MGSAEELLSAKQKSTPATNKQTPSSKSTSKKESIKAKMEEEVAEESQQSSTSSESESEEEEPQKNLILSNERRNGGMIKNASENNKDTLAQALIANLFSIKAQQALEFISPQEIVENNVIKREFA